MDCTLSSATHCVYMISIFLFFFVSKLKKIPIKGTLFHSFTT